MLKKRGEEVDIKNIKPQIDKKMITLVGIASGCIILILTAIIYFTIDSKIRLENAKKYEDQVLEFAKEQKEQKEKEEQERLAKIPQLTEVGKNNLANIYEGDSKKAYLTFDDGPSRNTAGILDILKSNEIKATFFMLGKQVEIFPETTKRVYDEGHYIANHGYSHVYKQIYSSPENVLDEYNQTNKLIADRIGVPEYNSHLFRFPGGYKGGPYADLKEQAGQLLEQNNILYIDWNCLTGDSEKAEPSEEYLMSSLQRTSQGKNNLVVLMHDAHAKTMTVDFLQKAIDYLKEQGYEFDNFYSIIK